MNSKGAMFLVNRGLNPSIEELAPQRKTLANKYNGDPMDCIGGVLNDLTVNSKRWSVLHHGRPLLRQPEGRDHQVRRKSDYQRHHPQPRRKTRLRHHGRRSSRSMSKRTARSPTSMSLRS